MKKFVFTLQALANYKVALEKKQKANLASIMAQLNALQKERDHILKAAADTAALLRQTLEEQREVIQELKRHDNYQRYLREWLADVQRQILVAQAEKKRLQALLIITMKEIKNLERLRAEEYQAYLSEVRKEENQIISDIIAYNSTITAAE
jgi:DNA-binding helix-hairpin-helix protein with protein kinase domain